MYTARVLVQFWDELKRFPNIPYKPFGPGMWEAIPREYR